MEPTAQATWNVIQFGRPRYMKPETAASLAAKLEKSGAILQEALSAVRPEDLERTGTFPWGQEYKVSWLLSLICYHTSCHFGQIQMIRQHLA